MSRRGGWQCGECSGWWPEAIPTCIDCLVRERDAAEASRDIAVDALRHIVECRTCRIHPEHIEAARAALVELNPDGLSEPPSRGMGSPSPSGLESPTAPGGSLSPSSEVAACPRCGSTASYWSSWPPGTYGPSSEVAAPFFGGGILGPPIGPQGTGAPAAEAAPERAGRPDLGGTAGAVPGSGGKS